MEFADYSRFFFALAFVVGLIWAMAWAAKKAGLDRKVRGISGNARGRMQLVETLYLDPRKKLTLVRADAREYLILSSGEQVQLVDKWEGKNDAVV